MCHSISVDKLKLFSSYIEENEDIIVAISENKFDIFISNISLSKIKFYQLELPISAKRLEAIEKIQSYILDV